MCAWALPLRLLPGELVADSWGLLMADVGIRALAIAFAAVCA
jgi:hypothetical protein